MTTAPETSDGPIEDLMNEGYGRLQEHWLNHARLAFQQVLARQPAHAEATRQLGVTLVRMQRFDEGVALLRASTALAPLVGGGWRDLGTACRRAGDTAGSDAAWREALAFDPGLAQAPAWMRTEFASERIKGSVTLMDYEYRPVSRFGRGRASHPELCRRLDEGRATYEDHLERFAACAPLLATIPARGDYRALTPFWLNTWTPPLDAIALIGMLQTHRPRTYLEVGSGMSTRFARLAIDHFGLATRVVSIDPMPRTPIDALVDEPIRKRFEDVDLAVFLALGAGDILFIDGSHRSFPGSDVTVFFLEVLPRLAPGVIVHVHDIYLPDDYVAGHVPRLWNEQYLLACALLYGGAGLEVLFPAWYVSHEPGFAHALTARLAPGELAGLYVHGVSFWMRKTA